MPAGPIRAYLVTPYALGPRGHWAKEGETICFEREFALEIAEADGDAATWVGVFALDADGRRLSRAPIACYGAPGLPPDAILLAEAAGAKWALREGGGGGIALRRRSGAGLQ